MLRYLEHLANRVEEIHQEGSDLIAVQIIGAIRIVFGPQGLDVVGGERFKGPADSCQYVYDRAGQVAHLFFKIDTQTLGLVLPSVPVVLAGPAGGGVVLVSTTAGAASGGEELAGAVVAVLAVLPPMGAEPPALSPKAVRLASRPTS